MSVETANDGEIGYYIDVHLVYTDIWKTLTAIIPRIFQKTMYGLSKIYSKKIPH